MLHLLTVLALTVLSGSEAAVGWGDEFNPTDFLDFLPDSVSMTCTRDQHVSEQPVEAPSHRMSAEWHFLYIEVSSRLSVS
jgi:hypothetical protein